MRKQGREKTKVLVKRIHLPSPGTTLLQLSQAQKGRARTSCHRTGDVSEMCKGHISSMSEPPQYTPSNYIPAPPAPRSYTPPPPRIILLPPAASARRRTRPPLTTGSLACLLVLGVLLPPLAVYLVDHCSCESPAAGSSSIAIRGPSSS